MAEIERHMIACLRDEAGSTPQVPSISIMGDCGHQVWISESAMAFQLTSDDKIEVACVECALKFAGEDPEATEHLPIPGAFKDIDARLGPGAGKSAWERWLKGLPK